jgi:rRNA-processing protein EBP2
VAVDNELKSHANKQETARPRGGRDGGPGSHAKRQKKDDKYGFGGRKRFSKSGDAVSTGDMSGFSVRRMKDGPSRGGGSARRGGRGGRGGASGARGGKPTPRLGKSRRKAMAGKG